MAKRVILSVNGVQRTVVAGPEDSLATVLREQLGLTGTHVGCDTSQCGACTVHVNGRAVKSCAMLAVQAQGAEVTTIEGMAAPDGTMHPMQAAFKECHGLQCGFCTPGMVMSAVDLCKNHPNASEGEIRELLEGHQVGQGVAAQDVLHRAGVLLRVGRVDPEEIPEEGD